MFGIIEEDQGSYTRRRHSHNGYYAGDFSSTVARPPAAVKPTTVPRTAAQPAARVCA